MRLSEQVGVREAHRSPPTPLESPQSNGMAEFVCTIKRDYVRVSPRPDAETVMRQLPGWIAHYNEIRTRLSATVHPASSSQLTQDPDRVRSFGGYNTLWEPVQGDPERLPVLTLDRGGSGAPQPTQEPVFGVAADAECSEIAVR